MPIIIADDNVSGPFGAEFETLLPRALDVRLGYGHISGCKLTDAELGSLPSKIVLRTPKNKPMRHASFYQNRRLFISAEVRQLFLELGETHLTYHKLHAYSEYPISGTTEHGNWYLVLDVPRLNDCVVVEKTRFRHGFGLEGYRASRKPREMNAIDPKGPCVLKREAIVGHHFWCVAGDGWAYDPFVSDEFWAKWQQRGYLGLMPGYDFVCDVQD